MSFYKFQGAIIISQRVILRPQLLTQVLSDGSTTLPFMTYHVSKLWQKLWF